MIDVTDVVLLSAEERMQNAGLVDEKGDLKEGSHLIFSALDGFRLGIEGEPSHCGHCRPAV
jgi:hypothetical protein